MRRLDRLLASWRIDELASQQGGHCTFFTACGAGTACIAACTVGRERADARHARVTDACALVQPR